MDLATHYIIEVILVVSFLPSPSLCSIDGKTYMDDLNFGPYKRIPAGEDPCNPLYWYPRAIPDYCYRRNIPVIPADPQPPPSTPYPEPRPPAMQPLMPPPIPIPMALPPCPIPMAPPPIFPMSNPYPQCLPPPYVSPGMPSSLPYMQPTMPGMPVPANSYYTGYGFGPGYYRPTGQVGLMPGLPGLVTRDGGINILPFADVYSDMFEKHKQKMIRLRLQVLLDNYDGVSGRYGRRHGRRKRFF